LRFGLDLARATAIVLVLISHGAMFWAPLVGNQLFNSTGVFWLTGFDGVELFFSLSGFLIGRLLLEIQCRDPSAKAVKIFLIRRWMRTLPLYYLVLMACVVFPEIEPNARENILAYFLLMQNLFTRMPSSNWFGISWSLTIEEWSYVALPILAFYVCRLQRNPVACAALILIIIGFTVRLGIGLTNGVPTLSEWDKLIRKLVASRTDAVAFGVLGAVFIQRYGQIGRSWFPPLAAALLGLNAWICYHPELIPGVVGWLALFPLTGVGFTLLLLWLNDLPTPKAFAPPIQFLARISYGVYLVHWPLMFVTLKVATPFQLIVFIGSSLLVATFLFYAVEDPIMRMRPKQL
jgi:peptidoglycan/LPS O-acetylase OafA/YrhL